MVKKYCWLMLVLLVACSQPKVTPAQVFNSYVNVAYYTYQDTLKSSRILQEKIRQFLKNPSLMLLSLVQREWEETYNHYKQTEAFYLNPAARVIVERLDSNLGSTDQGLAFLANEAIPVDFHGLQDFADSDQPLVGFRVLEWLLWSDAREEAILEKYLPSRQENVRRRDYLQLVADILVQDLAQIAEFWHPEKAYVKELIQEGNIDQVLEPLIMMSRTRLAGEYLHIATSEGESAIQACRSGLFHNNFIYGAQGIENVYLGQYGHYQGESLYHLLRLYDSALAERVLHQLSRTRHYAESIPTPISTEVQLAKEGSLGRQVMAQLADSLVAQTELLESAKVVLHRDL